MAEIRQNFSIIHEDDLDVEFDIFGDPPVDLSVAQSLTWTAYKQLAMAVPDESQPVIVKDIAGGGITIIDPIEMTFVLHVLSADTAPLSNGNYVHTVLLIDQGGRRSTTTVGLVTVIDESSQPNVISFKTVFSAFIEVDDTTVQIALDECSQYVDATWEDQQIPATMYLAAHFLAVSAEGGEAGGQLISAERLGVISTNYAAAVAAGTQESLLMNTVYGRQFYQYLRINSGGIAIV